MTGWAFSGLDAGHNRAWSASPLEGQPSCSPVRTPRMIPSPAHPIPLVRQHVGAQKKPSKARWWREFEGMGAACRPHTLSRPTSVCRGLVVMCACEGIIRGVLALQLPGSCSRGDGSGPRSYPAVEPGAGTHRHQPGAHTVTHHPTKTSPKPLDSTKRTNKKARKDHSMRAFAFQAAINQTSTSA